MKAPQTCRLYKLFWQRKTKIFTWTVSTLSSLEELIFLWLNWKYSGPWVKQKDETGEKTIFLGSQTCGGALKNTQNPPWTNWIRTSNRCVCMPVCAYMYTCVQLRVNMCMHVCLCVWVYVYVCMHVFVCAYVCECVRVWILYMPKCVYWVRTENHCSRPFIYLDSLKLLKHNPH